MKFCPAVVRYGISDDRCNRAASDFIKQNRLVRKDQPILFYTGNRLF
jgi:hypothetical protein